MYLFTVGTLLSSLIFQEKAYQNKARSKGLLNKTLNPATLISSSRKHYQPVLGKELTWNLPPRLDRVSLGSAQAFSSFQATSETRGCDLIKTVLKETCSTSCFTSALQSMDLTALSAWHTWIYSATRSEGPLMNIWRHGLWRHDPSKISLGHPTRHF